MESIKILLKELEAEAAVAAVPAETHYRIALCYHALGGAVEKARDHYRQAASGDVNGYIPEFHLARLERGLPLLPSTQADLEAYRFEKSPHFSRAEQGQCETAPNPADSTPESISGKEVEACIAAIRREAAQSFKKGEAEMSQDLQVIAQYLQDVAGEKKPAIPEGPGSGPAVCRILAENQLSALLGNAALFAPKLTGLCTKLSEIAEPMCGELADGFHALATHAAHFRFMELAARLLTYKSPDEAIKRHSAELTPKLLEAIQRAIDLAKANGNRALADRLSTLIVPIKTELIGSGDRRVVAPLV